MQLLSPWEGAMNLYPTTLSLLYMHDYAIAFIYEITTSNLNVSPSVESFADYSERAFKHLTGRCVTRNLLCKVV